MGYGRLSLSDSGSRHDHLCINLMSHVQSNPRLKQKMEAELESDWRDDATTTTSESVHSLRSHPLRLEDPSLVLAARNCRINPFICHTCTARGQLCACVLMQVEA